MRTLRASARLSQFLVCGKVIAEPVLLTQVVMLIA
jgi:hypothetical protein